MPSAASSSGWHSWSGVIGCRWSARSSSAFPPSPPSTFRLPSVCSECTRPSPAVRWCWPRSPSGSPSSGRSRLWRPNAAGLDGHRNMGTSSNGRRAEVAVGDSRADLLRTLHDEHAAALWSFVLGLTNGDRGRAEDVVQETLLRAWRRPELLQVDADGHSSGSIRGLLF